MPVPVRQGPPTAGGASDRFDRLRTTAPDGGGTLMAEPEQTPTQALLDGRYRLGECIGEGGMARVHRGEDLILERTVAVKMIRASDGGTSSVARTRGEVAVLASLSHPPWWPSSTRASSRGSPSTW